MIRRRHMENIRITIASSAALFLAEWYQPAFVSISTRNKSIHQIGTFGPNPGSWAVATAANARVPDLEPSLFQDNRSKERDEIFKPQRDLRLPGVCSLANLWRDIVCSYQIIPNRPERRKNAEEQI